MLDPKKVYETMKMSSEMGTKSQASLNKPFVEGVSNMNMSGSDIAKNVMNDVMKNCEGMFNQMNEVFNDLQRNLVAHQDLQTGEQPQDFSPEMNDLRETIAKGFPSESAEFLSKMPKF